MSQSNQSRYDFVIAGGGLQGGLIVHALRYFQPESSVLLIEKNKDLCGNHTWSFHASDIPDQPQAWFHPLPRKTWSGYKVQFPDFERRVELPYCTISSMQLKDSIYNLASLADNAARQGVGVNLTIRTDTTVAHLGVDTVKTDRGETFYAENVIDCRGLSRETLDPGLKCGFQKFHGFEIETELDWPDVDPVLMDTRVSQLDGFRFFYVLPLSRRRVLFEETFFSDHPTICREESHRQLEAYLTARKLGGWKILREERGCLPMPYSRHLQPRSSSILTGGYAGGWFHAATGYSFPLAVRFAEAIASGPAAEVRQRLEELANQNRFQAKFSRFLNRLLYRAVSPSQRWQVFRRFYRVMPDSAIQRFYAHQFTRMDAVRMVVGRPPGGLTPVRFFTSNEDSPCLVTQ